MVIPLFEHARNMNIYLFCQFKISFAILTAKWSNCMDLQLDIIVQKKMVIKKYISLRMLFNLVFVI